MKTLKFSPFFNSVNFIIENQEHKKIDDTAEQFIISAYKLGISQLLIHRFLRESNYNCLMTDIYETLWKCDIFPDSYNCSSNSDVWRRYLTNILKDPEIKGIRHFKMIALQEAIDYYDINKNTLHNYWSQFNYWKKRAQSPPNHDWIIYGMHHFGFTFPRLSEILSKIDIEVSPSMLNNIYNANIHNYIPTGVDTQLRPKVMSYPSLREFWVLSHKIGKDIGTILEWTEIFTGTGVDESEIDTVIKNM